MYVFNTPIQFDCYYSALSRNGAWVDRNGQRQSYFAGNGASGNEWEDNNDYLDYGWSDSIHGICDCGLSKSCYNHPNTPENFCQCDSRDVVERSDFGFINNTVSL